MLLKKRLIIIKIRSSMIRRSQTMNCNVGTADRVARIVLGLAIGLAGVVFQSWFGLIGLIPLATGVAGRCPGYLPLGISTCGVPDER
jgi:hypothetical protein